MTSAAATSFELVTPQLAGKLARASVAAGRYIPIPTLADIRARHLWTKAYYLPRDMMVLKYIKMADLVSPFDADKDGLEEGMTVKPDGSVVSTTATFPFDIKTLAMSFVAETHPYVTNVRPSHPDHTDKTIADYDDFAQAVVDTWLKEYDFPPEMIAKLVDTGWLIPFYPFDPARLAQKKFPFELQLLSPLGVYPRLDSHNRPMWVTIERRVTGAQLLQDFSAYRVDGLKMPGGLAELFEAEPDLPEGSTKDRHDMAGNNLLSSIFTTVRYYDTNVTALLLDASNVSDFACDYNPALKAMKAASKKAKHSSILTGSQTDESDEYRGVLAHHMGVIPMSVEFMWPESRDATTLDPDIMAGRRGGLPLLYSQHPNWVEISRNYSALNSIAVRTANPPVLTDDESLETLNSEIIHLEPGKNLKYMDPPQISPEFVQLLGKLEASVDRGGFGPGAYGAAAGTSGRQQESVNAAGSIRQASIIRKISRATVAAVAGVTQIMIERGGDEKYFVGGDGGKKKDKKGYAMNYKAEPLKGVVPFFEVEYLERNAWVNPEKVSMFGALYEKVPYQWLVRNVMGEPRPEHLEEMLRDEAVQREKTVLQPYIDKAALEAQTSLLKDVNALQQKLQEMKDWLALEQEKKDIEREMLQLPLEVANQKYLDTLQKMAQAGGLTLQPDPLNLIAAPQQPQQPGQAESISGNPPPPSGAPSLSQGSMPGLPSTMPNTQMMNPSASRPQMPPPMMMGGSSMMPTPPMGGMPSGLPAPGGLPPGSGPVQPPSGPVGMQPRYAQGPGQMQRPIQPPAAFVPPGALGRPGVASPIAGSGQGVPSAAQLPPRLEIANRQAMPVRPTQPTGKRPTRRGKRGR